MRTLADRIQSGHPTATDRDLTPHDLMHLGYGPEMATRIAALLEEEDLMSHYCSRAAKAGCTPITRVSTAYPLLLRKRLGLDSPGVLWARGDTSLLAQPAVALVGSRDLQDDNRRFAEEVGRQAALQGYVLVSGNARGADRTAQNSCLAHGGQVISIVADELWKQPDHDRILYLSEDGFDEAFSSQRALSRNRCIHALGLKTFVAQSALKTGGTWDGTAKNLRFHWSSVYCFDDGSNAANLLCQMGAIPIVPQALESFYDLPKEISFLDV